MGGLHAFWWMVWVRLLCSLCCMGLVDLWVVCVFVVFLVVWLLCWWVGGGLVLLLYFGWDGWFGGLCWVYVGLLAMRLRRLWFDLFVCMFGVRVIGLFKVWCVLIVLI